MFCGSCGTQIPEGSKFCPNCGTAVEVPVQVVRKKGGAGKLVGIIAGVCVLILALGVGAAYLFLGRKTTINLNKYMTISYSGYETIGKASAVFDTDKFEADYKDKIKFTKAAKKEFESAKGELGELGNLVSDLDDVEAALAAYGFTPASLLEDGFNGSLDKTDGLSNGDKVVYTWTISEQDEKDFEKYLNVKIKYSDIEGTVEGLETATLFDPFEGVEIVYSGIAPDGTAQIQNSNTSGVYGYLDYQLDKSYELSNGDEITATVTTYYGDSLEDYCLENYGMIPSQTEKVFTVDGLSSYIASASEISDDMLSKMKQQGLDIITANAASYWSDQVTLKEANYIGNYFLVEKPGAYADYHNIVNLVFEVVSTIDIDEDDAKYKADIPYYYYVSFYDVMQMPDGVTSVDLSRYDTTYDYFNVDTGVDSGWWSTYNYDFKGYETLDTMFNKLVSASVDVYTYEDNIQDDLKNNNAQISSETEADKNEDSADYILPDSDTRLYTKAELNKFTAEELKIARNEIYARYGRKFKDEELQSYFDSKDWYVGLYTPEEFDKISNTLLSDTEKTNAELIKEVEDSKKD
ncbi:YARHG domain-containing protein [Butyrivibrio sp. WCD3002]|uniref:YARHG domain-containing protein n=1 Tax=Butyrivibrio sp. WCD3002 TaxID=1280676 RepID=UPI000405A901|nr:YARHG domain-containing protein [Butyrivibrio sp. WCD3002]